MLDLSPTKIVIILVVVVVLLGPKRLPHVARQLGATWGKLRALHQQVDQELRQTMPDLPSTQEIVRFARSPIRMLNQLADLPSHSDSLVEDRAAPLAPGDTGEELDHAPSDHRDALDGSLPIEDPGAPQGNGSTRGADVTSARRRRAHSTHYELVDLSGLDVDDPNLN